MAKRKPANMFDKKVAFEISFLGSWFLLLLSASLSRRSTIRFKVAFFLLTFPILLCLRYGRAANVTPRSCNSSVIDFLLNSSLADIIRGEQCL